MTRTRTNFGHTWTHAVLDAGARATACAVACAATLMIAGCLNESTTLVGAGSAPLPDLCSPTSAGHSAESGASASDSTAVGAPATLTTTIDRSHWPAIVVAQPRDQLAWSFFGGPSPEWAISHGPPALPPVASPNFTRKDAQANASAAAASEPAGPANSSAPASN